MRSAAKQLAPKLPFAAGTTGIVTTANVAYMPACLVSLRLLRRTGNNLPVEVFIDDWSHYDSVVCVTVLPSLNARCVVMSNVFDSVKPAAKPDHYQYKTFSLLFSSFQHVLFLDSDSFPIYDPSALVTTAPYTTHGLVTWPDFLALTTSTHFFHVAAIPEQPSQGRLASESGQVMINKDIHRESILMMVYYNYYGPEYYYVLLCQGPPGTGDKETFAQAALAVGLPYYQVKTPPTALARYMGDEKRGTGIAQADAGLDFEYLTRMPSHIHTDELWQDVDLEHPDPAMAKEQRKAPSPPRTLFVHHNILKLNPANVLSDQNQPTYENGKPHRIWGDKDDMAALLGFDVQHRVDRRRRSRM